MRMITAVRTLAVLLLASLAPGSPALAQTIEPPDGITVVGQGRANAPADSTTFRISLSGGMFPGEPGWQPFGTPEAGADGQIQSLLDALADAGVAAADVTIVLPPYIGNALFGPFGPVAAFIEFTIDDPDTDRVREILDAANMGAAESMMVLGEIMVIHTVADCSSLQEEALTDAFENARERATRQADVLGVSLGEVTASRDSLYGISPFDPFAGLAENGSCSYSGASVTSFGPTGPMSYDLASEPEVVVLATLDVTFAIGSGSPATPES